jgi:hypothetical protein
MYSEAVGAELILRMGNELSGAGQKHGEMC